MRDKNLDLLVAVCAGAPEQTGWIRYFTGAEMWGGREFVVIEPDSLERLVIIRSTYDAEWIRQQAVATRVESTLLESLPPVTRTVEAVAEMTQGTGRIGMINSQLLTPFEEEAFRQGLQGVEREDVTDDVNRIRQVKSKFEIAAIE